MARSISFDILAVDKASKQLEEVGREVSDLAQKIDRADGTIEVDADTARAQEKLAAVDSQLARLNAKSFKVDADTDAAERQIKILRAELERTTDADKRIRVEADIAGAQAKLRSLAAEKVSIDVDTGAAQAKVAAIKAAIDGVDRKKTTTVDVDVASAWSKLATLGQQMRGVATPVTISIAVVGAMEALSWIQSVAAGLASLGAVGVVSGGIAAASFMGIGDAVKAMGEKAETGGAKASTSASAIRSATRQVESAQRDLANANAQVLVSEDNLARTQDDARRAVEALDDARKAAIRTLEDYDMRSKGMALSQESASLSIQEAQARLNELNNDSKATSLERARAELTVREAIQRRNDLEVEGTRLSEDKAAADAKGIEGSDQVVSAQDRIAEANRRVQDAQKQLAKSHEDVALAVQRLSDSQLALQEAMTPKGGGGGTTVDKLAEAMKNLTPEGQEFVRFLRGLIDGPLKELKDDAQSSFLPGLQAGIQSFMDELDNASGDITVVAQEMGEFFTDIGPSAGKAADAFLRLARLGADTTFEGLAGAINKALDAFTEWANSQSPQKIQSDIKEIGNTIVEIKNDAVLAFRAIQFAYEAITFPVGVFFGPKQAVDDLSESYRNFAQHIPFLRDHLPEVETGVRSVGDSATNANPSVGAIGTTADGTASAMQRLADAARQAAGQFASQEQANIQFESSLARGKAAIETNGATLDIHTEKGRSNRQTLLDVASAANNVIDSMQNANAPTAQVTQTFESQRAKLVEQATQFGLTKSQAQAYIDKLLQTPKTVTTTATVNTAAAVARITDLQNRLATLNGALTVSQNTGKQGQGAGVYKSSGGWVGDSLAGTPFGGGPKGSDTVPGWLDPKEFVIRSSAAAKWGPLLELINAGGTPAEVGAQLGAGAPALTGGATASGSPVFNLNITTGAVLSSRDELARHVLEVLKEAGARGQLQSIGIS